SEYGPGTRALLEMGAEVSEAAYREALAGREAFKAAVARAFDGVDVLAGPTVAYTAPPEDPPVGTPEGELEGRYTGPWNVAGVPVLPSLPYGITPYFGAYPGSPTVGAETYGALLRDIAGSLHGQGFRRFFIVNGHGGNTPGREPLESWAAEAGAQVIWHDWWS